MPLTIMHGLDVLDPFLHCVSSVPLGTLLLWKELEEEARGRSKAGEKKLV